VTIENLDWRLLLKDYDNTEMVWYLDPPYVRYSKGMYEHEFSKQDHFDLCEYIFNRVKGYVALSGYGDEETKAIYDRYKWTHVEEWETTCVAAGFAFTDTNNLAGTEGTFARGKVKENLWIKEAG
jgi:site-specific DNA-adenine methylase